MEEGSPIENQEVKLIGTVRAEPETVVSRAGVQSPDPVE